MSARLLPLALLALLPAAPARAQNAQAGTSAAQFLKLGAGARSAAMGEAGVALADDLTAVYYNPAGLTEETRPSFAGMHEARFQSIRYEFLGFGLPLHDRAGRVRHAFAAAATNLATDGIERRVEDTDVPIEEFGVSDTAFALAYAFKPSPRFSAGGSAKFVRSRLDSVKATAVAADLGVRARVLERGKVDAGVVVRHLGTRLDYGQAADPLPLTVGAGVAARPADGLALAADVLKARDTDAYFALGAEYRRKVGGWSAAGRAGYTTHFKDAGEIKGWSLGAGLSLGRASFDAAWIPFGDLGDTFRYSLLVRF